MEWLKYGYLGLIVFSGWGCQWDPDCRNSKSEVDVKNGKGAIACKLTDSEMRKRKEAVSRELFQFLSGYDELENGYAFRFPKREGMRERILSFVALEKQCCSFLEFEVSISGREILLKVTGSEGSKGFLESQINLSELR